MTAKGRHLTNGKWGPRAQTIQPRSADSMFLVQLDCSGLRLSVSEVTASHSSLGWRAGSWKLSPHSYPLSDLSLACRSADLCLFGIWVEQDQLSRQLGSKLEGQSVIKVCVVPHSPMWCWCWLSALGFPRHGNICEMCDSPSLIARKYDVGPWYCIEGRIKIKMHH